LVKNSIGDLLARDLARLARRSGSVIHHARALAEPMPSHAIAMIDAALGALLMPRAGLLLAAPPTHVAARIPAKRVSAIATRADKKCPAAFAARPHAQRFVVHVPPARRSAGRLLVRVS